LSRTPEELHKLAKKVLAENWCGTYTKPSGQLYPHQWNWDSGFIAIGYAHYDLDKARQELRSLFRAQWRNGMLPHIVFNPAEADYFPGPEFWQASRSPAAPKDVRGSGITQPPIHAIAALQIYRHSEQARAFLKEILPKIKSLHRYLYAYRDPYKEGLAYVGHPWETGTDNSPAWGEPLNRIDPHSLGPLDYRRKDLRVVSANQRPTQADYDRYVYLVEVHKRADYQEEAIFRESPFLIQDPLFNGLLCKANEDLIEIAEILGEDSGEIREWHQQTRRAVDAKLWSEDRGLYTPYDLVQRKQLAADSISGFIPLFAGIPGPERARRLLKRLESPGFSGPRGECFSVPSYDMESAAFDPVSYWRGPVWVNMDWMLYHGLRRYGFHEKAMAVRRDALALVSRFGFYEYFSPYRSRDRGAIGGLGGAGFSWTAALCIDLIAEREDRGGDTNAR
jgi:glycogen debranching enzyme